MGLAFHRFAEDLIQESLCINSTRANTNTIGRRWWVHIQHISLILLCVNLFDPTSIGIVPILATMNKFIDRGPFSGHPWSLCPFMWISCHYLVMCMHREYLSRWCSHALMKYWTISSGSLAWMPLYSDSLVGRSKSPAPRTWAASKLMPITKILPPCNNCLNQRGFKVMESIV